MIFGEKSIFAIECTVTQVNPALMGFSRLWVAGLHIGRYEQVNYIYPLYSGLSDTLNSINVTNRNELANFATESAIDFLSSSDDGHDAIPDLGEGYEDFSLYFYRIDSRVKIVWRLRPDPFFNYSDYPLGLNESTVDLSVFSNTLKAFQKSLSELAPNYSEGEAGGEAEGVKP